jgi:hypothetical protein
MTPRTPFGAAQSSLKSTKTNTLVASTIRRLRHRFSGVVTMATVPR